jgi:hypothetical protein
MPNDYTSFDQAGNPKSPAGVPGSSLGDKGRSSHRDKDWATRTPGNIKSRPTSPAILTTYEGKCYSDRRRRGIGSNRLVSWGAPSVRLTATMVPHLVAGPIASVLALQARSSYWTSARGNPPGHWSAPGAHQKIGAQGAVGCSPGLFNALYLSC